MPCSPSEHTRARRFLRRRAGRFARALQGPGGPKAEATLKAVLDAVKESVWLFDRDGVCLLGNETALRRFGCPRDQVIGRPFIEVTDPDPGLQRMAALREVVATGRPQETFDDRAGTSFHHFWYPVLDDQGRVAQVVSFSYDITPRKRAEARLRESEAFLKEEARRKDAFLAMLGHELRNPLAPIRNALHLIGQQSPVGEPVAAACAIAQRQLTHLTRLVDDLLDVARIARGQVHLKRSDLDLGAILQAVLEDYHAVLAEQGLILETNLPAPRVPIQADATRIVQAVHNLLSNAVKFTPRGGRIRLEVGTRGLEAYLRIQDTGVGIAPDLLPSLFDPFRQSKEAVGRSRGGLGLGLALAKGFVEVHGGTLAARSGGPGLGAEFTLTLPLTEPPGAPVQGDRPAPGPDPGRTRRILVVEDQTDAAITLKMVLELAGHSVAVAQDGLAALACAEVFGPDLVICDIGLPGGLDGYQVARILRRTPRGNELTLIALTGFGTQEDRDQALQAGFDLHLTKPVDPEILVPMIARLG